MHKKRKPIPEAKLKALQEFRVLSIKYHAKGDEIPKYVYDRLYKALMS